MSCPPGQLPIYIFDFIRTGQIQRNKRTDKLSKTNYIFENGETSCKQMKENMFVRPTTVNLTFSVRKGNTSSGHQFVRTAVKLGAIVPRQYLGWLYMTKETTKMLCYLVLSNDEPKIKRDSSSGCPVSVGAGLVNQSCNNSPILVEN
ncbi:6410_t:CDS:2 [Diversispora eburnea]|uniref:6410_t:CDS:1 n=1 Tax=Diversispora eburnea TaxID=1213867 RepID=A0A9N9GGH4_9GLOM|nr:6410_t:CDS:2 [Diversispora eburnea]